ncbi:cupin domain-containing protein [Streptomyces phaeochromogenes]
MDGTVRPWVWQSTGGRPQKQAIAGLTEPDGTHTTPTVDYGIVLAGEVVLELDDGHCTPLSAGDIVFQNGTRHAWRSLGEGPATMAFVTHRQRA